MIITKNLARTYTVGKVKVHALRDISIKIKKGEFVAIMGPSGSGKSTLLHQLGIIDRPTSGKVLIERTDVFKLTNGQQTMFRLKKIGLVFQFYSLLPELNALENVYVPKMLMGCTRKECEEKAMQMLETLGLADRAYHKPNELSGGEQQRVAVARAIINEPKVLLADEPTANLDTEAGLNIIKIFKKLNKKFKQTIAMVTHEKYLGKHADRIIWLKDGRVEKRQKIQ